MFENVAGVCARDVGVWSVHSIEVCEECVWSV